MKRKITLLALAGNGGALGASGLLNGVTPSAAMACRTIKPSPPKSPASATDPKPPPISQRNSRRVLPQNEPPDAPRGCCEKCRFMSNIASSEIQKRIRIQGEQAILLERVVCTQMFIIDQAIDEVHIALNFTWDRLAGRGKADRTADLLGQVVRSIASKSV